MADSLKKLCKLRLETYNLQNAMDTFTQFVKIFKSEVGDSQRAYEHWAWVSRQYVVFAELLEHFGIKGALIGRLYQSAATYMKTRKAAFQRASNSVHLETETIQAYANQLPDNLSKIDSKRQVFIGQYLVDIEHPLDALEHKSAVHENLSVTSLAKERNVNHSELIIGFLTRAYTFFEEHNRAKLSTVALIALERYHEGQFDKALKFYERMIPEFRREGWYSLLAMPLHASIECAKSLGLTKELIYYSLLSLHPMIPSLNVEGLQKSLMQVFSSPSQEECKVEIQVFASDEKNLFTAFFRFEDPTYYCGDNLKCKVKLISHFPLPIRFQKLFVEFNDPNYNQTLTDTHPCTDTEDSIENSLLFFPNKPTIISLEMPSKKKMGFLECVSISLTLLRDENFSACLKWDVSGWPPMEEIHITTLQIQPCSFPNRTSTTYKSFFNLKFPN